jgi:hypothetical protein
VIDGDDLVVLFTGTPIEAQLTGSLLEAVKIEVFIKDEIMGSIAPWCTGPGPAGASKVMVRQRDLEEARALLESTVDASAI